MKKPKRIDEIYDGYNMHMLDKLIMIIKIFALYGIVA